MNDNIVIEDLFESDEYVELIASHMDKIDELKNRMPKLSENEGLEYVDKSFFKRVLSDITNIEINGDTLKVYFDRGVKMHIESATTDAEVYNSSIRDTDYRSYKIINELIEMGEITLKTSPFYVEMTKDDLRANYYPSLEESLNDLDLSVNIHDWGLNCWGGWGGPVRFNYDSLNIENSLMIMTQRMQQLNIDDFARSFDKMSLLIYYVYRGEPLNINPVILARLIVEYDLEKNVLEDEHFDYFGRSEDGTLRLLDIAKTNIDYYTFIDLLKHISNNYVGDKPKIKPKRSDM